MMPARRALVEGEGLRKPREARKRPDEFLHDRKAGCFSTALCFLCDKPPFRLCLDDAMRGIRCKIKAREGKEDLEDAHHEKDREERDDLKPAGAKEFWDIVDAQVLEDKVEDEDRDDGVVYGVDEEMVGLKRLIEEELADDDDEEKDEGDRDEPIHKVLDAVEPGFHDGAFGKRVF
jgi:hypothetical protein